MTAGWDIIEDRATPAQRRSLYRLGVAPSLVRRLDKRQADESIRALLSLRQTLGNIPPKKKKKI